MNVVSVKRDVSANVEKGGVMNYPKPCEYCGCDEGIKDCCWEALRDYEDEKGCHDYHARRDEELAEEYE